MACTCSAQRVILAVSDKAQHRRCCLPASGLRGKSLSKLDYWRTKFSRPIAAGATARVAVPSGSRPLPNGSDPKQGKAPCGTRPQQSTPARVDQFCAPHHAARRPGRIPQAVAAPVEGATESETARVLNVAVVGKDGVGKSKLVDAALKCFTHDKAKQRVERNVKEEVELPEEKAHNVTIWPHLYHEERDGYTLNMMDTPGSSDLLPKTRTLLQVTNGIVFVTGPRGVDDSIRRLWATVTEQRKERCIFVNRMDGEGVSFATFQKAVEALEEQLGRGGPGRGEETLVVLYAPYFDEKGALAGVINLLDLTVHFGDNVAPLSPTQLDVVRSWRDALIDRVAETDDTVMEWLLAGDGRPVPQPELRAALQRAVQSCKVTPILVGSAKSQIGVPQLDDFMEEFFPVKDQQPWLGYTSPAAEELVERYPHPQEPFSGWIFQTTVDRYVGRLSFLYVVSGTLEGKAPALLNSSMGETVQVGKVLVCSSGHHCQQVAYAHPGDIVVLEKVDCRVGDTLCDKDSPVWYQPLSMPKPRCTFRLDLSNERNEERVITSLQKVMSEDPSLRLHRNEDTQELLFSGHGSNHIETTLEHIRNMFGIELKLDIPHIAFHETITKTIQGHGRHKKQTGGHGQFGEVTMRFEPLLRGAGFLFENESKGAVVPKNYFAAVEKGVIEGLKDGALGRFPTVDIRAVLVDGKHHPVDSSDFSFQQAGLLAVRDALPKGGPILLEPIFRMVVEVAEDDVGKVSKDISSVRRGRIEGYEPSSLGMSKIRALVPLMEMRNYPQMLSALTQGQGVFSLELEAYEPIAGSVIDSVLQLRKKELGGKIW